MLRAILAMMNQRIVRANLYNILEDSMREWAILVKADFQAFIKDWNEKPVFEEKFTSNGREIYWEYSSDNRILGFVSHGTKIRYATMTPNFIAKTVVSGRIPSVPGRGGLLFVNRNRPKPGIVGRKIDFRIKRKNKNKLTKLVNDKATAYARR